MATTWHYRRHEVERGPLGFPELVQIVRAGDLAADDLVREDWNPDWRPAALAVGLFHMAGRQDLFDRWEAEQAELRGREADAAAAPGKTSTDDEPTWQRRLRDVEAEAQALQEQGRAERAAERAANATRTEIDVTLAAALAEVEARERSLVPSRWQMLRERAANPKTLHRVLRYGLALALPNLIARAILNWSELEAQRFPKPESLAGGLRAFPLWGECDPALYFFLLFDTMILGGVAGYFFARTLERCVEN